MDDILVERMALCLRCVVHFLDVAYTLYMHGINVSSRTIALFCPVPVPSPDDPPVETS
jgi:hypothetical protein